MIPVRMRIVFECDGIKLTFDLDSEREIPLPDCQIELVICRNSYVFDRSLMWGGSIMWATLTPTKKEHAQILTLDLRQDENWIEATVTT